jgi:hypothetical protein
MSFYWSYLEYILTLFRSVGHAGPRPLIAAKAAAPLPAEGNPFMQSFGPMQTTP